jgi:hypothetical protein
MFQDLSAFTMKLKLSIFILLFLYHFASGTESQLPDLVPLDGIQNVFRVQNGGQCQDEKGLLLPPVSLCQGLLKPSRSSPHVVQVVKIPGIVWGIRNNSASGFTSTIPVDVRLKSGAQVLQEMKITSMGPREIRTFTYNRPENRRRLMRDLDCPGCYDLNVAPFNWSDPERLTVEVNFPVLLKESDLTNNVKTYQRSEESIPSTATISN